MNQFKIRTKRMTDFELLSQLQAEFRMIGHPLRDDLRLELATRLTEHARQRHRSGSWMLARGVELTEFYIGPAEAPRLIVTDSVGVYAFSFAVLNPHRWVPLGRQRTRRAWRAAIDRALEAVARVDPGLSNALGPPESVNGPGLRLRVDDDDRCWARWVPPPGARVQPSVPLPCPA